MDSILLIYMQLDRYFHCKLCIDLINGESSSPLSEFDRKLILRQTYSDQDSKHMW